jgi:diacylglycerol O-acyltransferase
MFRMNGADAFLLAAETPRSYQHTLKIGILDPSGEPGGWSFEQYRSAILPRLHVSPVFRWKLAPSPLGFNHPMWIDDPDFKIDHHLKHVACPAPGDQKALCELISSLYADQLDRSRPLWKCWVIEGLEGGKIAQVTIIHHAYADGAAASHILQQFFSTELGAEPSGPGAEWQPPASPSWFKRLLLDIRDWPKVMFYYLPKAISGVIKKRKLDSAVRKSGQPPHPNAGMMQKTPINTVLGHGRTFVCDSFPLAGIGNFATADYSWLHAEIGDPVERLMASRRSANEMKAHAAASKGADLGTIVALLPPWLIKCLHWVIRRNAGATGLLGNVILSNVPGPRAPLYLNRTRLDNWFSTGQVFEGSSLNMTLWSYCENANLCILADKKAVPDGWVLFNYFMEELQILIDKAKQQTQDNSEEKIA